MKPIVLIVEDREKSLRARARLFSQLGMVVVAATTKAEAEQKFRYLPNVDLVVCDFNLDNTNDDDAGGVEFAKSLRRDGFDGPMVLYSGRDDADIAANVIGINPAGIETVSEEIPFNDSAQKAHMPTEKRTEWLGLAISHMNTRSKESLRIVEQLGRKYDISSVDMTKLVDLVPGSEINMNSGKESDSLPFRNQEFESAARKEGFRAALIGSGFPSTVEDTLRLEKPLMIWIRDVKNGVYVESAGCSEIGAKGQNEEDACRKLLLRMKELREDPNTAQHVSQFVDQFIS